MKNRLAELEKYSLVLSKQVVLFKSEILFYCLYKLMESDQRDPSDSVQTVICIDKMSKVRK